MPAPRIDTVRNRIAATRELLRMIEQELGDLHVLAYDRKAARREVQGVAGGKPDWALDTHGDRRARDAYRDLSTTTVEACESLADTAHGAIRLLREAEDSPRPRTARTIKIEELADAIDAQARRAARAEYEPVRRHPQPEQAEAVRELKAQNRQLSAELKTWRRIGQRLEDGWFPHQDARMWVQSDPDDFAGKRSPISEAEANLIWPETEATDVVASTS